MTDAKSDSKVDALSLDDETGSIKLQSKDGKDYHVEKKYAYVSTLVKTSLDTGNSSSNARNT